MIHSTALFQPGFSTTCWESVVDHVLQLAHEGVLLRREAGFVLHESIQRIATYSANVEEYLTLMLERLCRIKLAKSPEGIAIWLSVLSTAPTVNSPKGVWRNENPLHPKERDAVNKILRNNQNIEQRDAAKSDDTDTGAAQRVPSFAWSVIIAHLSGLCSREHGRNDLSHFWAAVVDGWLSSTLRQTLKS